jgi:hypothetical protein
MDWSSVVMIYRQVRYIEEIDSVLRGFGVACLVHIKTESYVAASWRHMLSRRIEVHMECLQTMHLELSLTEF